MFRNCAAILLVCFDMTAAAIVQQHLTAAFDMTAAAVVR
jgi:hypothetical protein